MTKLQEPYVILYIHEKYFDIEAEFFNDEGELVGSKTVTRNESLALGDLQRYPPKEGKPLKLTVSELKDEVFFDEDDNFLYWLEKIR